MISVIIPAHNAAATLDRTLRSVRHQSSNRWEVVIVDDGSTDQTADLARSLTADDARFRVLEQRQSGASAARNTGLASANGQWVLFLDADDLIEPGYFEAALEMLDADPALDGVRCRWLLESISGRRLPEPDPLGAAGATLLSTSRWICPLAIHACIVSRRRVEEAGRFDPALSVAEDWDLWARMGRDGLRLGDLEVPYAVYVLHAGSMTRRDFARVHADCATVLHRINKDAVGPADPRREPPPDGSVIDSLLRDNFLWALGLTAGAGADPGPLLDLAPPMSRLDVDPERIGDTLFTEAARGAGFFEDEWPGRWDELWDGVTATVAAFTTWAGAPDAARPILRRLEQRIAEVATTPGDAVGRTVGIRVDLRHPVGSVAGLDDVEQLVLRVHDGDARIGSAVVAVVDDVVGSEAISEAIDHQLTFELLRAARRRPSATRRLLRSLAPGRLARIASRLALDPPDPSHRRELGRAALRAALDPSSRGTVAPDADRWSTNGSVDADYWENIFSEPDPWSYTNSYEQLKYEQTLSLIEGLGAERALELACAEGHFTAQLAGLVDHLIATDISATALGRAATRCHDHSNIEFRPLDLTVDEVPSDLDLIVCSEVLYYYDRPSLVRLAERIRDALTPNGAFVTAHANLLTHEPRSTGFDWGHDVTAAVIREVFLSTPGMVLERELGNDLYRVMRFRRVEAASAPAPPPAAEHVPYATPLDPMIDRMVVWGGFATSRDEAGRDELTDRVPVLMYHRIADEDGGPLDRYRTSPAAFEAQLAHLRRHGYHGITLRQWWGHLARREPLDGRAVVLTFDDGYEDFALDAWPLLDAYGFPATVFVVPELVGAKADWDRDLVEPAALMDWDTIRQLSRAGLDIGSHSGTHRPLISLSPREALRQEREAQDTFRRELGHGIATLAYPFGAVDEVVRQTMRAAGYQVAVETRHGWATVWDDPMAIPRLEVPGGIGAEEFAVLLGEPRRRSVLRKRLRELRRWR